MMNIIKGKLGYGNSVMAYFDTDSGILYKAMEDNRVVIENSAGNHNIIILDGELANQLRIMLEQKQINRPKGQIPAW